MNAPPLYGLVAEFSDPTALVRAVEAARGEGYRALDAFTPYSVEGLPEALGIRWTGVPLLALCGGIGGGTLGLVMQASSAGWFYPINVGGRPLLSWPSFVPIIFELTVLGACLSAVFGMILLNRLPRLHHPIFDTPHYEERSASRFYLCLEARDPHFDSEKTRAFLAAHNPLEVWEVPA